MRPAMVARRSSRQRLSRQIRYSLLLKQQRPLSRKQRIVAGNLPSIRPFALIALGKSGSNAMKKEITIADKYGPAMLITEQVGADHYFWILVEHSMSFGKTKGEAEVIERANLGYYAGYYDNETRARVERLFACAHPVFGNIAEKGPPTLDQAFRAGLDAGTPGERRREMRSLFPGGGVKSNATPLGDP